MIYRVNYRDDRGRPSNILRFAESEAEARESVLAVYGRQITIVSIAVVRQ